MKRSGFTIVELLVVMMIIVTLMGLFTSAVTGSIKAGRERRAAALCKVVQSGLATYYAQKGEWPGSLGSRVANGFKGGANDEGAAGQTDADLYVLTASEVREMVKALVDEAKKGNPLVDVSALYVSRSPGEKGGHDRGMDFMTAIRGTKQSKRKMKTAEMYFGYPESGHGYFRRFKMTYSIPTDAVAVSEQ